MKKDALKINSTDRLEFDLVMSPVDYNEQKKKALRQEIADKYGVPLKNVRVNFIPLQLNENGEKVSLTSEIIDNIQDPKFQQSLFPEYLKLNNIEDIDMNEIIEIDNQINTFVDFNSYTKNKVYKFKYVKWDNYLSYGKDNFFDFTKLNGLVLLTSSPENQGGKTTFAIDLLRFALFGRADKSPTLESVINDYLPKETEACVEACIEIDGDDYVIRRTITRPALSKRTTKSKAKQKVEYFKLLNGSYELIENCEGENTSATNNIIRETVGNVDDFNLVISATVHTLSNLMNLGQTEKSKVFSRWLGLVSLEEKDKITKEYYKDKISKNLFSNKYDKTTLSNEINDFKTVILSNNSQIKALNEKKKENDNQLEKFNLEKTGLLGQKREVKENINFNVQTIENNIQTTNGELELKRSQFVSLKEEYEKIKDATFDKELLDSKNELVNQLTAKNGEIRGIIMSMKAEIDRIKKLSNENICPVCKHPIDVNEQNGLIAEAEAKIAEYTKQGVENKGQIDKLKEEIVNLNLKREETERLNNLKLKLSAFKVTIDNLKLKLNEFNRLKEEYEKNKENLIFNTDIDCKVNVVNEKIKVETRLKEENIRAIQSLESTNESYANEISKREKIIRQLISEEKIIRNWTVYQQIIGKNGIIKLVLKRALPIINNELNRLLNGLCDFDVELSVSDDNKVCLDMVHDGHVLDLSRAASGFEACMASLALRCALSNIASFSKPNMLVLDEVLSGVSSTNMKNIMELYHRVLSNYDFIIHICHDTTLVDYHDKILTVVKENNVSRICEDY